LPFFLPYLSLYGFSPATEFATVSGDGVELFALEKTSFSDDAPGALPRRCGAPVAIVLYYREKDFR